jgi:hypothetical protein
VTGDEALSFEASPATVDGAALEETDYQQYRADSDNVTREFSAAGQTREVTVTNQVRGYNRSLPLGPLGEQDLGRFIAVSSPAVEVAGETFNPIGDWSNRRLVSELADSYEGLDDTEFEGNRTVTARGDARTVSTFTGTSTVAGQEVDVRVHVTKFRHGDDFVIALAVHPEEIDEEGRVDALAEGLRHDSNSG